ncbi:MAG: hypothetical protein KGY70_20280, partial [Bacteroidales bacterium]|nr:hypothetical protein [Bacteroidales bacterium]
MTDVKIRVAVDSEKAESGVRRVNKALGNTDTQARQADKQTSRFNRTLNTMGGTARRAGKAIFSWKTAMGAAAGAAGLGYLIKQNIDAADKIAKTADSIGVTTDALQEYRYIAERSGVATNKLDQGLKKFASRMSDLETGSGPLINRLEDVNDETLEMIKNADSTGKAFDIVLQQMKKYEGQVDATRIATAAVGREQAATFTNMAKNARELEQRYERLGIEIDENMLRKSEQAKDSIDDLGAVIESSFMRTVLQLAPEIGQAADNMADWVAENDEFITQDLPQKLSNLAEGFGKVYGAAEKLVDFLHESDKEILQEQVKKLEQEIETKIEIYQKQAEAFREHQGDLWGDFLGATDAITKESLKEQRHEIAELKQELVGYKLTLEQMSAPQKEFTKSINDQAEAQQKVREEAEKTAKILPFSKPDLPEFDVNLEDLQEAKRIWEETRYPIEEALVEVDKLNDLYRKGLISLNTYLRGGGQAWEEYLRTIEKENEETTSEIDKLYENMLENIQSNFADSIHDMLDGQVHSWEDFFGSILDMFKRMIAEMAAVDITRKIFQGEDIKGAGLFTGSDGGFVQQLLSRDSEGGGGDLGIPGLSRLGSMTIPGTAGSMTVPTAVGGEGATMATPGTTFGSAMGPAGPAAGAIGLSETADYAYSQTGMPKNWYSDPWQATKGVGDIVTGDPSQGSMAAASHFVLPYVGPAIFSSIFGGDRYHEPWASFGAGKEQKEYEELVNKRGTAQTGEFDFFAAVNERSADLPTEKIEGAIIDYFDSVLGTLNEAIGGGLQEIISKDPAWFPSHYVQKYFEEDGEGMKALLSDMTEKMIGQYADALFDAVVDTDQSVFDKSFLEDMQKEGENLGNTFLRVA